MNNQKILVYDLETTDVDPTKAIPVLAGFMSSETPEWIWTSNIEEMSAIINAHDVIVGYNIRDYDNEIMKRYGVMFRGKIIIDLMNILHGGGFGNDLGRKGIVTTPEGVHLGTILHGKSLAETTKCLGGPLKIGDFDYNLFKKSFGDLTDAQQTEALEYLKADLDATKYIYEYLENFFEFVKSGGEEIDGEFRRFMTDEQVRKKHYLTASTASMVYKIICNLAGEQERYGNGQAEPYGGGFVAVPTQEVAEGDIYCLDYNSLYPHIMMMCNLYGAIGYNYEDIPVWQGEGISQTEGKYDKSDLAPVGRVLKRLYSRRLEYKKDKNAKEYTIKIIINTIYGLLGNPAFVSVSNYTAAADCTRLGRQWVNAARLHFAEHGYNVLYTDTDSVYLADPFHNQAKLMEVRDKHIKDIKSSVPFPQDTFDMGVDDEISYMAFFKAHDGTLLKKNYLYVTKAGKLKVKGMQIIKSTCTPLAKHIFERFISPEILSNSRGQKMRHKWQRSQIEQWIEEALKEDITLASVFFKCRTPESYKLASQIQAQIANHVLYGEGQHNMIKLKVPHEKGAGTQQNYVGVQFAEEIKLGQIDLTKTWNELAPFIEETQQTLEGFW
jgi:hypothetical protein